jgi:hypothetical protein
MCWVRTLRATHTACCADSLRVLGDLADRERRRTSGDWPKRMPLNRDSPVQLLGGIRRNTRKNVANRLVISANNFLSA